MKISLKQLQVFVLTNKLGSVSKAAENCFITQSAASMSLSELEKMLGFPLFDRVGKKLKLNTNGETLLTKAIAIVDQANEFEAFIDHKTINGTLDIGASTTIGNYVLPYYLAKFQKKYPDVNLQLNIANTEHVIYELNKLNIDIGIIEGNCYSETITKNAWKHDELVIIANHKHPLAKNDQVSYKELENYRWVCRERGSGTGELFLNYISGKFDPNIELTLSNPEAIKNYIRNSNCLTCVSKAIVSEKTDKDLKIINVKGFKLVRPFYLLSHMNKFKNAATQEFEKMLSIL